LLLNAATLLLPYKDPANPEIITQLSKLMLSFVKFCAATTVRMPATSAPLRKGLIFRLFCPYPASKCTV